MCAFGSTLQDSDLAGYYKVPLAAENGSLVGGSFFDRNTISELVTLTRSNILTDWVQ